MYDGVGWRQDGRADRGSEVPYRVDFQRRLLRGEIQLLDVGLSRERRIGIFSSAHNFLQAVSMFYLGTVIT